MKKINSTMRVHLWFETDSGMLFGLGRVILLKKVNEVGSLNKAAKALGMSYRAAWGKIKATEKELGDSLLEKSAEGRGYCLTEYGRSLLEDYDRWHREIEAFALKTADELFPWQVRPYEESRQNGKP